MRNVPFVLVLQSGKYGDYATPCKSVCDFAGVLNRFLASEGKRECVVDYAQDSVGDDPMEGLRECA
jgi:hypothetical protein